MFSPSGTIRADEGLAAVPAKRALDTADISPDASETKRRVRHRSLVIKKSIVYRDGFCREHCQRGRCYCYKAKFEQYCQACQVWIEEGHCITKQNYGWTHVRCRGDELREDQVSSLTNAIVPQAPALAALEGAGTLPQLTNNETKNKSIVTQDSSDEEDDGDWLTEEQKRIVNYKPSPGSLIRIDALAGCGKTTTCALICHKSNERFGENCKQLYVVFNTAAGTEAKNSHKFPKNVEIKTSHALAKRKLFGTEQFDIAQGGLDKDAVIEHLDLFDWTRDKFPSLKPAGVDKIAKTIACFVIQTVDIFQHSDDREITEDHVVEKATTTPLTERSMWKKCVSKEKYVTWAQSVFDLVSMQCKYQAEKSRKKQLKKPQPWMGITFDGYLKYLQLHKDEYEFNYDIVMVDEAQDMTPCQANLLWGSSVTRNAAVYLVGDENQRLYGFRGAKDSFEATPVTESFPLSGSFRFGQNIGAAANQVLAICSDARVQGLAANKGRIRDSSTTFERGVVICRTRNGMLHYLESHRPKKWTFLSKSQKLPSSSSKIFTALEDFYMGNNTSYCYRREVFSMWEDLKEFAAEEGDSDMMNNLWLLEDFHQRNVGASICATFEDVSRNRVQDWRKEQTEKGIVIPDINDFDGIVLVTCHGAKGLEFDQVYLYHDFGFDQLMKIESFVASKYLKEMLNLIYVGITRAKKALYLSSSAETFLEWAKERYNIENDSRDDVETESTHGGDEGSEDDLRQARETLDSEWLLFSQCQSVVESISDVPKPPGPKGNEFALCSTMTIAQQRSFIKKYMLRYNKFLHSFGNRIQLESQQERKTFEQSINDWCRICNTLWSMLRDQDDGAEA